MSGGRNRFPFTAAQWQELEHQALIFKYMASGIPLPPHLLFTISTTSLHSPFVSTLFPHQYAHVGWNYLQMGSGRKIDPEPGRCRRTDGKKWRCSKEAFPDSKYCERHMHRGKNRSRKPVEVLKTTTHSPPISSITHNSTLPSETHSQHLHPFLYQHGSSSAPQNSITSLLLDPHYRRNRYGYGVKEDVVDEHRFLSEERGGNMRGFSASNMEDSWELSPLRMSCSSSSFRHKNCSPLQGGDYSYKEPEKGMHHFLDEWSPKDTESWVDLNTTRLSISIPNSSQHEFRSNNKHNQNP
ncbi:Growth-regulating factor 5, partial [Cucurbita argyrosperma subsp. sororia]